MRGDAGFSRAHLGLSIVGETFQSSRLPWHWLLSSWEQPAFIGCGVSGKLTLACSPLRPRFLAKAAVSPSFASAISQQLWSSVRVEPQDCFTAGLPEDEQDNLVLFSPCDVGTSFGLFKAAQRLLEGSVRRAAAICQKQHSVTVSHRVLLSAESPLTDLRSEKKDFFLNAGFVELR